MVRFRNSENLGCKAKQNVSVSFGICLLSQATITGILLLIALHCVAISWLESLENCLL